MNDDYEQLLAQLRRESLWPALYFFKFIIPADLKKIALIESRFSEKAIISLHESSKGKYVSVSIKEIMPTPESVVDKYKQMGDIEGLMAF